MQGTSEILNKLGYSQQGTDDLLFPSDRKPSADKTAAVVCDLVQAVQELLAYCDRTHPRMETFMEMTPFGLRLGFHLNFSVQHKERNYNPSYFI